MCMRRFPVIISSKFRYSRNSARRISDTFVPAMTMIVKRFKHVPSANVNPAVIITRAISYDAESN